MDIRTKLVFALVAVALGSMAALGLVMSLGAMDALQESREEQLDGLAEAKKEGLEQVFRGWEDRVRLVASHTQLRQTLREHLRSESPDTGARMERILADALDAVAGVHSLTVYDLEGRTVTRVARPSGTPFPATAVGAPRPGPATPDDGVRYAGIAVGEGTPLVEFHADLELEDETLGVLHVRLVPLEVFELAAVRTRLGDTGETLIVLPDDGGGAWTIRPAGDGTSELSGHVGVGEAPDPVRLALEGREDLFREGVTDADGDAVWASVRQLASTGWGLVVKLDAEEGREPGAALRRDLTRVGLSLGAFAILAGVILGFRFTRPILDLSAVADRIRQGELDARATVATHDEVGHLARLFNEMADELEERLTELKQFHTFFEVSRDLLCIAGTDGYLKRVNPAFERVVGWSDDELVSRPITDFVHDDDVMATAREIDRLGEGLPTISFENRWRHAEGGYRRLRWTCHPDPETGLLYAVARDVTDTGGWRGASPPTDDDTGPRSEP